MYIYTLYVHVHVQCLPSVAHLDTPSRLPFPFLLAARAALTSLAVTTRASSHPRPHLSAPSLTSASDRLRRHPAISRTRSSAPLLSSVRARSHLKLRNSSSSSIGSNQSRCQSPASPPVTDTSLKSASLPVGGRLKHFWQKWQDAGASHKVVRWLRFGYPLPFVKDTRGRAITPPLSFSPKPNLVTSYADPSRQSVLDQMLSELILKRAIREIPHDSRAFFSRVFLVPKKNGKMRLVIDLSLLNQWLACPTFKMDHAQVVRDALSPGMWATSIDLSDAYLHIPVHEAFWPYLVFQVGNRRFQFLVLPFGLNTAPRVFSDVMKVIKRWARLLGMLLFQYLDDWLQLNLCRSSLAHQTSQLIHKCEELGLLVNLEKSEIVPLQEIVFLGDLLDFHSGFIFPTRDRFESIQTKIDKVTRSESASLRALQSLMGSITATEKIVPFGRFHARALQALIVHHVSRSVPQATQLTLSLQVLQDLLWWSDTDHVFRGLSMSTAIPDLQVQTDASTTGWGVSFQGAVLSGHWSPEDAKLHINVLEMKAVLLACQRLTYHFRSKCVLFLIDNQTVVSYLKNQGGTRSLQLMSVTRQVLELAERELILIKAQHIQGQLNAVADLASRRGYVVNTEWSLSPKMFQFVQKQSPWGPASIDLFANSLNHRLPLYVSPCPDPAAMSVNALVVGWPQDAILYAFPPTTIMDRALHKIIKERPHHLLLIAPRLLEAPWYPLLQQLPCSKSIALPLQIGDLLQPHWNHAHLSPRLFNLHLWCIRFQP